MSSNTLQRIVSAIVMVLIVVACLYGGRVTSIIMLGVIGTLVTDELLVNFIKVKRFSKRYLTGLSVFAAPFFIICLFPYFGFAPFTWFEYLRSPLVFAGIAFNVLLLCYLFGLDINSESAVKFFTKNFYVVSLFALLPLASLVDIVQYDQWVSYIAVLFFINFGMDTGAWFFGKNFGKHKLWPSVSPKKTVEGLIGGALTSGFLGGILWHTLFGTMSVSYFFFFAFLGCMSQLGDLIQSKIKRQFKIKDSSSLIPGHGGVYDRVDSLLYLSPFFAMALRQFLG